MEPHSISLMYTIEYTELASRVHEQKYHCLFNSTISYINLILTTQEHYVLAYNKAPVKKHRMTLIIQPKARKVKRMKQVEIGIPKKMF